MEVSITSNRISFEPELKQLDIEIFIYTPTSHNCENRVGFTFWFLAIYLFCFEELNILFLKK